MIFALGAVFMENQIIDRGSDGNGSRIHKIWGRRKNRLPACLDATLVGPVCGLIVAFRLINAGKINSEADY